MIRRVVKVIVKSVFKDDDSIDSIGDCGYDSGSYEKSMTVVIRWLVARHQDVETVPGVILLFLSKNKLSYYRTLKGTLLSWRKRCWLIMIIIVIRMMIIQVTLVAQVHCPQSQAQELQTKVESWLLRGRQDTRLNTSSSSSSAW